AGGELVASVTFESSESLGLEVGTPVTAIFKANSVILGVRS
ncbi:MAG: molybdenum-dependent transcriptional regulator, partial [Gammaproteobacteria bacterium]|nr:molybdenum-dependent transcriptional regulator [Gammaproteobacteria bacterium]